MAITASKKKVQHVSAQREQVQSLIATATATEAALIAAESALDSLAASVTLYTSN